MKNYLNINPNATPLVKRLAKDGFNENQIKALIIMVENYTDHVDNNFTCRNKWVGQEFVADYNAKYGWDITPRQFSSFCSGISKHAKKNNIDYISYWNVKDEIKTKEDELFWKQFPSYARQEFFLNCDVFSCIAK